MGLLLSPMSVTNSLDKPGPFYRDLIDTFEAPFLRERIWKKKVACFKRVHCQTPGNTAGHYFSPLQLYPSKIPCS
jgi:hypothetical protein